VCSTASSTLTSISALLEPSVVRRVLDSYWREDGPQPETYTADLPWRLYVVARETGRLNEAELDELAEMRADMGRGRRGGVTLKNRRLIRQIKTTDVLDKGGRLTRAAHGRGAPRAGSRPLKAAVKAQVAVAIAMLTFAPVRIGNLVSTRLEDNLTRFGGPDGRFYLHYPEYEVKNRVDLEFSFDSELTKIVSEYIELYRPVLLRGYNERWLFPGLSGRHKAKHLLSMQMCEIILKRTGLRIIAHQFRHVAAAVLLKQFPANYPFVAKLLGHKNGRTAEKFYVALEGRGGARLAPTPAQELSRADAQHTAQAY
jgi:integrase